MFQHLPTINALGHSEPFTRHGTPKLLQASVRRPGNRRMNLRQPSCTKAEARSHESIGNRHSAAALRWLHEMRNKA